jgi:hypothetical protein
MQVEERFRASAEMIAVCDLFKDRMSDRRIRSTAKSDRLLELIWINIQLTQFCC